MLEVLIAVLVFSLGMLGLAGLLIFAIQSNHVAYLRTQATFLAHNMADRMSANPVGLWNGDYNTALDPPGTPVPSSTASYVPATLAAYDIAAWSQQVHVFLPNANGTIECTDTHLAYLPTSAQVANRPPYGGTCHMYLQWTESGTPSPQTFAWVFQP